MSGYRITVVCLGNICRSPIGEAVLRQRIIEQGITGIQVDSAGTGDWHVGQGANPRTVAVLAERGYPTDHVARQITPDWLADIDLVLAMDEANYHDIEQMIELSGATTHLRMFRSFDPDLAHLAEPHADLSVPDPYYGTPGDFRTVTDMIEKASDAVLAHALAH